MYFQSNETVSIGYNRLLWQGRWEIGRASCISFARVGVRGAEGTSKSVQIVLSSPLDDYPAGHFHFGLAPTHQVGDDFLPFSARLSRYRHQTQEAVHQHVAVPYLWPR